MWNLSSGPINGINENAETKEEHERKQRSKWRHITASVSCFVSLKMKPNLRNDTNPSNCPPVFQFPSVAFSQKVCFWCESRQDFYFPFFGFLVENVQPLQKLFLDADLWPRELRLPNLALLLHLLLWGYALAVKLFISSQQSNSLRTIASLTFSKCCKS